MRQVLPLNLHTPSRQSAYGQGQLSDIVTWHSVLKRTSLCVIDVHEVAPLEDEEEGSQVSPLRRGSNIICSTQNLDKVTYFRNIQVMFLESWLFSKRKNNRRILDKNTMDSLQLMGGHAFKKTSWIMYSFNMCFEYKDLIMEAPDL